MSCAFGFFGFVAACVAQKPGVRQTTGSVVLLVLLDVDELVLVEVDELVELLVLLDVDELDELLELLEVLVLVDVLVVVVWISVPSCLSERNG